MKMFILIKRNSIKCINLKFFKNADFRDCLDVVNLELEISLYG